jgi:hypothetical protein
MIACDDVIEDGQAIAFPGLEEPMPPSPAITHKLQQEFPLMASMGYVPDVSRAKNAVCSGHIVRKSIPV